MELKLLCNCGQKFKFDVEPVNGLMPFAVNCPVCGADGTPAANALLAQNIPPAPPPPITVAARTAPPGPITAARPIPKPKQDKDFNLGLGVVGAIAGALVGVALAYGFFRWAGFRLPYSGTAIGALAGFSARKLHRGTGSTIGIVAAACGVLGAATASYLMYGDLIGTDFAGAFYRSLAITALFSGWFGWKIASG